MTDRVEQQQAAIDEFLDLLRHERRGDTWVGRTPDWYGPVVFGGVGLALTISAACGDAPAGSRLHSLHAHFLRPVLGGQEIVFRSEVVKAGRTFNLHHVTASQDGKPVITMTCSFTTDTDGYVYDLSGIPDGVPLPEDLPEPDDTEDEVGPWDERWLGPEPAATRRHPRGDASPLVPPAPNARRRPAPAHRAARLRHRLDRHRWAAPPPRRRHHRHDQSRSRRLVPPARPRRRLAPPGRAEPRQRRRPRHPARRRSGTRRA